MNNSTTQKLNMINNWIQSIPHTVIFHGIDKS